MMTALLRSFSFSAVVAGFVTVLVGFTSSAVIVFQAAHALGAKPEEIGSWMWALGLGMGATCIGLSLRYKVPVVTAWSTPGAAMLIASAASVQMGEAVGAFVVSGLLITLCGFTGWFERAISRIPMSIASGMLAGILLRFGLDVFVSMKTQFGMICAMFAVYLVMRRAQPRYAVIGALAAGIAIAGAQGMLRFGGVSLELAEPLLTIPQFSIKAIVGVALPLFAVTMASQNMPGVAVIRASGYTVPISPLIGWTGAATLVLAPFGAFALNLAAITAAICMGREAHEDPAKRYPAAIAAGIFYLLIGLFGATVAAVFSAFPKELVLAIAGLALLGTIGNGLASALTNEKDREAALVTFLVTASGTTLFGIGSAFWGLVAGASALLVSRVSRRHLEFLRLRRREADASALLLKRARLKFPDASMESIDFASDRNLSKAQFDLFATNEWVRKARNILLTGPTGIGKTWLACALGNHACLAGFSVLYVRMPRLIEEFRSARQAGVLPALFKRMAETDVLILDEWGAYPLQAGDRADLFELIDDRAGVRPTVIASRLPLEHWHLYLNDLIVGEAIIERIGHRSHIVKLKGESLRQQEAYPDEMRRKLTLASKREAGA
jgi:benzoate membrane transport protein